MLKLSLRCSVSSTRKLLMKISPTIPKSPFMGLLLLYNVHSAYGKLRSKTKICYSSDCSITTLVYLFAHMYVQHIEKNYHTLKNVEEESVKREKKKCMKVSSTTFSSHFCELH